MLHIKFGEIPLHRYQICIYQENYEKHSITLLPIEEGEFK